MNSEVFWKVSSQRHLNDFSTVWCADERKKDKNPRCYSEDELGWLLLDYNVWFWKKSQVERSLALCWVLIFSIPRLSNCIQCFFAILLSIQLSKLSTEFSFLILTLCNNSGKIQWLSSIFYLPINENSNWFL